MTREQASVTNEADSEEDDDDEEEEVSEQDKKRAEEEEIRRTTTIPCRSEDRSAAAEMLRSTQ